MLSQAFHSQVLCHGQERVQLLLSNINFSVVHEVEDRLEISELDALQIEEGVLVGVSAQHIPEEWTAC